jgi:hypothetical protein
VPSLLADVEISDLAGFDVTPTPSPHAHDAPTPTPSPRPPKNPSRPGVGFPSLLSPRRPASSARAVRPAVRPVVSRRTWTARVLVFAANVCMLCTGRRCRR